MSSLLLTFYGLIYVVIFISYISRYLTHLPLFDTFEKELCSESGDTTPVFFVKLCSVVFQKKLFKALYCIIIVLLSLQQTF